MSTLETAAFGVLWLLVMGLALLVLVLYRQLDRLIIREQTAGASLLPAGSLLPDLLVVGSRGLEALEPPDHQDFWLLGFVTTTCPACQTFLRELTLIPRDFPSEVVVRGEQLDKEPQDPAIKCRWIATPGDLQTYFGVTVVPTIYLVREKTIIAGTLDGSSTGLRRLIEAGLSVRNGAGGYESPALQPINSST
jgi:hypothetical protein